MSEYRQNSVSSDLDKEAEDMDDIASTPPFSMTSTTSEDLANLDELMHRDDVLEDQEVTWLRTHSSLSDESSWCSSSDSDISERITPFDQNVDEEIKKVCQSFFNLENLETEADDFGEDDYVRTTSTGSTSSLAIRSNECTVTAPLEHLKDLSPGSQQGSLCSEEIPSTSCSAALGATLLSMNSATSEDLADLDELMHRDDVLEDQEVTLLRTHSSLSDESRMTYPSSWCSSPDSEISGRITPFDQNVDEEIKKVCQGFFNLENLETEADDFGEDDYVRTTSTGSTSSLAIRSNECTVTAPLEHLKDLSPGSQQGSLCSEEIPSTSCSAALGATLLSMNSATSEDLADLDELMHRDDVLEDQEVTWMRTHSSLSDESRMTYPSSWCSSPDSEISGRITPFDQNVDEEIKKVCQGFFNLENLETEADDFGEDNDVRTTDTGSTSSLVIRSNECTVTAPLEYLKDLSPGSQQGSLCSEEMPSTSCSAALGATLLSMNSATSEDLADLDELMHRDDVLEDQEVTLLRTHSSLSDESRMTYPSSWCSSPDSEISGRITPFKQNIDKEIKQVCQNFVNLEKLQTRAEECEAKVKVRTTNTVSMSSLSIRSNESTVPASCPSSSVKTQQSTESFKMFKDSDAPPQSDLSSSSLGCLPSKDRAAKKSLKRAMKTMKSFLPEGSTAVKTIKTGGHKGKRKKSQWKWCFRGRQSNKIHPAPLEHMDETVRSANTNKTLRRTGENKQGTLCSQETPSTTSCIAALGADLRSTELMLVDYEEDEDQKPEDTRKVLSPLSIASSITPDEFQEEMSSSLSQQSTDSDEGDEETFCQSSVEKSRLDSECLSNNQNDAEETKAKRRNHFSSFFSNIFSKLSIQAKSATLLPHFHLQSSTPADRSRASFGLVFALLRRHHRCKIPSGV